MALPPCFRKLVLEWSGISIIPFHSIIQAHPGIADDGGRRAGRRRRRLRLDLSRVAWERGSTESARRAALPIMMARARAWRVVA